MLSARNSILACLLISLLTAVIFQSSAVAADFSKNPFLESQQQLLKSRNYATLLNTATPPASNPTRVIIGSPATGPRVDDTTSDTNAFSPFVGPGGGFYSGIATPYLYSPATRIMAGVPGIAGSAALAAPYAWHGYRGIGGFGGFGYPGLGWRGGFGGFGYPGYAYPGYGLGYGGFGGFGGLGYGGWGWNPGGAALSMGAFGNWVDNNELGEMGSAPSWVVNDSTPSKSSGNYYAPSTKDPSAAGNYYSTNSPAINMPIKPYTSPKSYWGQSGSPLPKDINKVPW